LVQARGFKFRSSCIAAVERVALCAAPRANMHPTACTAIVVALAISSAHGNDGAAELTEENFEEQIFQSGKTFSFVKFLAPW